jgi:hypothetical protein
MSRIKQAAQLLGSRGGKVTAKKQSLVQKYGQPFHRLAAMGYKDFEVEQVGGSRQITAVKKESKES